MRNCPRCGEKDDYIPSGKGSVHSIGPITPLAKWHYGRCCIVVGDDIQSGPLYCGDRAEWVADSFDSDGKVNGKVMSCRYHKSSFDELERKSRARNNQGSESVSTADGNAQG